MNKIFYHIIFWIFIFLYVFDYFIDSFSYSESIIYSAFEVVLYSSEFYANLFVLIPLVLIKKGKAAYSISLIILFSISSSAYFLTGLNETLLAPAVTRAVTSFILNHSLFIFISYIVWYSNKYFKEKQLRLQSENEKLKLEMMLLKSQISPHFLFNTLNNIYSLAISKSEDAPKMISSLSDILRYFIYEGNNSVVFLEEEIDAINKYIQLQRYRQIPGMNNIIFSHPEKSSALKIPPLILMTFTENAFKHGNIIEDKNGYVKITLSVENKRIGFSIINSFQKKENENGIGLKNIISQLDILYGNDYNLNIEEDNSIYKVSLNFYGAEE